MARKTRRMLSLLMVLMLLAAQTAMAASMDVYFNTDSKVYLTPSQKSASMGVPKNMDVELVAVNGAWAQVRNGSAVAYCRLADLNLEDRLVGYTAEGAYLYAKATTSSASIGPAVANTKVYVIGLENGFYRVQNANGSVTGYVKTSQVSPTKYSVKKEENVSRIVGYTAEGAYLYAKASTSSTSIGPAPANLKVYVIGEKGNFYVVQNKDASITGYVKKSMLSPTKYSTKPKATATPAPTATPEPTLTRIVGYTAAGAYLYAAPNTSSEAIGPAALNTKVYVIGVEGNFFKVENSDGSLVGYVKIGELSSTKYTAPTATPVPTPTPAPETNNDPLSKVVKMDWFNGGSEVLARGEYAVLYDIYSNQTINVKRMGGSNHADLEPATAEDTAKLKAACGGEFSWESRPVILIVGDTYVAAAIYAVPHGDETILDNNFDGQFCLHMINSRTHGSDTVNELHQQAIEFAYAWAHD